MGISSITHKVLVSAVRSFRKLRGGVVRTYLRLVGVEFGPRLRIHSFPICRRHAGAKISIGSDVWINNSTAENLAGVPHPTVLVANRPGAEIRIGNNVGISGAVLFCNSRIIVEDYVNIGAGVRVYDTDFHPISWVERRLNNPEAIDAQPVRICQDAWICAHAIVLKGVTIGERSIVAAGAIVTSNVPPDCVVGGVPAKVLRSLTEVKVPSR